MNVSRPEIIDRDPYCARFLAYLEPIEPRAELLAERNGMFKQFLYRGR
ncbi:MAG: hypothetical protein HY848_12745 [Betaproteobacteria bacterium]|nr:hypothetical protein [Betaproteobacteria bacterium]